MKHINTGKAELLLVKFPDGAKNLFMHKDKLFWAIDKHPWGEFEKLPSETWKILGSPFELTEEQWKDIVAPIPVEIPPGPGNDFCGDCFYGYLDYELPGEYAGWGGDAGYCGTATESGLSLLLANNIYRENPYGEKPHETFNHPEWEYIRAKWQDAENNVGNWICLIKVKDL